MNRAALLPVVLLLAACSEGDGRTATDPAAVASAGVPHGLDPAKVVRGSEIYRQHCASCHGGRAQGAFAWQQRGVDGKYPPPPLDGSAHAWHHPMAALKQTIRDGTQRLGGSMPPWRGKLSEADIEAVIAWFQSTWPDEIYRAWAEIDERAQRGQHAAH